MNNVDNNLEVTKKLICPSMILPKNETIYNVSKTGRIPVFIDFKVNLNLVFVTSVGVLKVIQTDDEYGYNHVQQETETIYEILSNLNKGTDHPGAYSVQYVPILKGINITSNLNANKNLQTYGDILSIEDYYMIFKLWWNYRCVVNKLLTRAEKNLMRSFKIPVGVFDANLKCFEDILEPLIKSTVLAEHFTIYTANTKSNNLDLLNTKTYWVSFKNAMEFLGTTDYKEVTPVNIMECLLANVGYIESSKYAYNSRVYTNYVDNYDITRYQLLQTSNQEIATTDETTFDDVSIGGLV